MEDITFTFSEDSEILAKFKCVETAHLDLVKFRAELSDTFSEQPDPIHPPQTLDCSSL